MDTKTNIIGVFNNEDQLIAAIEKAKEKNIQVTEAYTPYPVHEVLHLLKRKSNIPTAGYIYGVLGALIILSFMYYVSVIDWPINYGGKPSFAFPSFLVITIIFTILFTTIASLFTFSVRAKLFPGNPGKIIDQRATDDKFVLVINKNLHEGQADIVNDILQEAGASDIYERD